MIKLGQLLEIMIGSQTVFLNEKTDGVFAAMVLFEANAESPAFEHYKDREVAKIWSSDSGMTILLAK